MPHAGLILGLPDLEVERVDRGDAFTVYAKSIVCSEKRSNPLKREEP